MKLTERQSRLLELWEVGETCMVSTSEYSIDPIPSTGWNPKFSADVRTLRGLVTKGFLTGEFFWRGFEGTRVR